MKRSPKAAVLAVSLVAIAQTAGAQTTPQPFAGCTVQTINGARQWVCPIGTFIVPPTAPPTIAATAPPTATPVVGLTLLPGLVIPQTDGSTFSIMTSMSVGIQGATQIVTVPLKSDVRANVPGATGIPASQNIVGLVLYPSNLVVAFSQANIATLQRDMPAGFTGVTTLRAVTFVYTTYVFQNGAWKAGSSQTATRSSKIMEMLDLSQTRTPSATGGLYAKQFI